MAKKTSCECVPHLGLVATVSTISFFLSLIFFLNWVTSGSVWHAAFFFGSFACFLAFLYPFLIKQKVRIEDGNITFVYRIGPPLTVRISDSLYQIVASSDEIRSFRFKTKKGKVQVSPKGYTDGDQLMKELRNAVKREMKTKKSFTKMAMSQRRNGSGLTGWNGSTSCPLLPTTYLSIFYFQIP